MKPILTEKYFTRGGDIYVSGTLGNHEFFCYAYPDGRIARHGLDANIEFGSASLRLSQRLLDWIEREMTDLVKTESVEVPEVA